MNVSGIVTFISSTSRTKDGKTYFNVNLESPDDGKIYNVSCQPEVLGKMQKYKSYLGYFELRTWENRILMSLVDVDDIK